MSQGTSSQQPADVRSELRGSHWVAWIPRSEDGQPLHAVLQVGATRDDAERRAMRWAERVAGGH